MVSMFARYLLQTIGSKSMVTQRSNNDISQLHPKLEMATRLLTTWQKYPQTGISKTRRPLMITIISNGFFEIL